MKDIYKGLDKRPSTARPIEAEEVSPDLIDPSVESAWQDPGVPRRQYEECTRPELAKYAKGIGVQPYDVLVEILKDNIADLDDKELLEIGCSSGYYSEVLKIKGIRAKYAGCDYSEAFIRFAKELFPGIDFQIQDASRLSYPDGAFDIVVSGGCLPCIPQYWQAISETARVSRQHVIFHRTPVFHRKETTYYLKTSYGVRMVEIHFNERDLHKLMRQYRLGVTDVITYHPALEEKYADFSGYKTYMCRKL
jgi:ubiquinone/menaquinone biosynthesis C-methylase UbiE